MTPEIVLAILASMPKEQRDEVLVRLIVKYVRDQQGFLETAIDDVTECRYCSNTGEHQQVTLTGYCLGCERYLELGDKEHGAPVL